MQAHRIFPDRWRINLTRPGVNIEAFRVQLLEGTPLGQRFAWRREYPFRRVQAIASLGNTVRFASSRVDEPVQSTAKPYAIASLVCLGFRPTPGSHR